MPTIALITAAGSGSRMGQDIPKQFITVNERPIIIYTLEAFENHPGIDEIAVVCLSGWEQLLNAYAKQFNISKLKYIIPGGSTGHESIRNGVFELEKHFGGDALVTIHDGNRPLVSSDIISDSIRVAKEHGNAVAVIPCVEAIVETGDGLTSTVTRPRDMLRRTQTPQTFRLSDICGLHRRAVEAGITNSVASCTLMIELGERIWFSSGSEKNIKLTTLDDIDIFKALLMAKRSDWLKG